MTTSIATPPKLQFFDANGVPLSGGKLYSYAAGTTTPLTTYTSSSGNTANTNPIILDSRGEANVWLSSATYKLKLTSSTNVEIWTVDNLNGADQATLASTFATLALSSGASLIGYTQGGADSVATTVQAKLRETVSITDFGAVGDGTTVDTNAIQFALDSGASTIYFPEGTFVVDQIFPPSNTTLVMTAGTTIKAISNIPANHRMLTIQGVSNVRVLGNGATITGIKSEYTSGEQRHGVFINIANTVVVSGLTVKDTGGDGIVITSSDELVGPTSENITIENCICDNNRRQGLSLVSGKKITINNCVFKNTTGTTPSSGIDIEPDAGSWQQLDDIVISNCEFNNNDGAGLSVFLPNSYTLSPGSVLPAINNNFNLTVENCAFYDNAYGFTFDANCADPTGVKVYGNISVSNCSFYDTTYSAIAAGRHSVNFDFMYFNNIFIRNANTAANTTTYLGSAITINGNNDVLANAQVGKISFNNVTVVDNSSTLQYTLAAGNASAITDVYFSGYINFVTGLGGSKMRIFLPTNWRFNDINNVTVPLSTSKTLDSYVDWNRYNNFSSPNNRTVTDSLFPYGSELNLNASGNSGYYIRFTPLATAVIHPLTTVAGTSIQSSVNGGSITLEKLSDGNWLVKSMATGWA